MFPPAFAPRMGYLCKYLKAGGWHLTVITEHIDDHVFAFLKNEVNVTYVRYYKQKGVFGKIEWGWVFLCDLLFHYKDKRMYREALKTMKSYAFDLILCSSYRTFPLYASLLLARKEKLPLVADLRDIIEQYTGDEFIAHRISGPSWWRKLITSLYRKRSISLRNKVLRKSSFVTTVSPWHVSILKKYNLNTQLIYNGYDPELFYPADIESKCFYITYTGRILSIAMRDPGLLFEAVERLAEDNIITPDTFRIRWFVDESSEKILEKEEQKYPSLMPYTEYHGYVPASEIPRVLNESSILLQLTNKSGNNGPNGMMTTKFFESLAVEKPILSVRGDEGALEDAINCTKCGLSAHNEEETYDFIKAHYLRWRENIPYESTADRHEIRKFSRKEQAEQFMQIFDELT